MAQPTRYTRKYNATTFGANNPGTPQPGTSLDAEFNAVKTTLDETLDNLALIQRDDGALKNGIVTAESLSAGLTLGFNSRGQWLTATAYAVDDTVFDAGVVYRCVEAHTSGTLAADVAAGKWVVFVDFTLDLGYTPENAANKDQPDGYAGLDSDGLLDIGIAPKRTLPRYRALSTTGGTSVLTVDQMDNRVIVVSGTLTSNAVLQVTDVERQWFIKNATSGGYTLTVKTAAGTGVAVTQGEWFTLYCDGTDVYQIGAAGLGALAFLDTVDTGQIDDDAITTAKIPDANVTTAKIANSAVTTGKIAAAAVTQSELGAGAVTTAKIADSNVTFAKLASAVVASQAQAEAGTATDVLMTPERTAQAIAELSPPPGPVLSRWGYLDAAAFTDVPAGSTTIIVHITWQHNAGGSRNLQLRLSDDAGSSSTAYTIAGTGVNGTYYYTVEVDLAAETFSINGSGSTSFSALGAVDAFRVSVSGDSTIAHGLAFII